MRRTTSRRCRRMRRRSHPIRSSLFASCRSVARYRFMLDEAQFTMMGFIKGPVCRGQLALDVITDHFWVLFARPDGESAELDAEFLAREAQESAPAGRARKHGPAALPGCITTGSSPTILSAKSAYLNAALRRRQSPDPGDAMGRRRPQSERRAHRVPPLRQRLGGAGPDRRAAADRDGDGLPAARAHPLPAGRRLRRLRQRRASARHAPVLRFHAHGRRDEFPEPPAARRAPGGARPLVSRREQPSTASACGISRRSTGRKPE